MAILEPKKAILEAKMEPCQIVWGLWRENGGMAEAYSEARIRRVQLEYRKVSYAGHPWQDAADLIANPQGGTTGAPPPSEDLGATLRGHRS